MLWWCMDVSHIYINNTGVNQVKRLAPAIFSDKPGDVDPSFENASIESKTPRYFQVDDLYRIAVAEVVYKHHSL